VDKTLTKFLKCLEVTSRSYSDTNLLLHIQIYFPPRWEFWEIKWSTSSEVYTGNLEKLQTKLWNSVQILSVTTMYNILLQCYSHNIDSEFPFFTLCMFSWPWSSHTADIIVILSSTQQLLLNHISTEESK